MIKTLPIYLLLLLISYSSKAQSNSEILNAIKKESSDSTIMTNISYFSDVFGPRLMGTPNYFNSIEYAKKQLDKWGLKTRFESFDKNYRGWSFSDFSVSMTQPSFAHINAYPLAFTNSTEGEVEGDLIFINSLQDAYDLEGKLTGKIIMLQALYYPVSSVKGPFYVRLSDKTLTAAQANPDPNHRIIGYHSRISVPSLFETRESTKQRMADFFQFLKEEGVIAVIEPSDRPYGLLHADGNRAVPSFRNSSDIKPLASFVISNEHFGRLLRLQEMGYNPRLKVSLSSIYYQNSDFNVNLIAEIPGTDLKDELVIIGAHFDSWHAGTGAVDNASGSAVMMEVMRILNAIDISPRRTIRLALWGGEEQIFAGSEFYIQENIGDFVTGAQKEEHPKVSAYFNIDNGAGKIRGVYLMGNEDVEPYFAEFLQPFEGSNTLTIQNANQTDHWLFDYHNIPGFQFIQDPLDYLPAIHHTNSDLYEYVPREDQLFNAELIAYLVYQVAQEKHMMPRKPLNFISPSRDGNVTFFLEGFDKADKVSVVGDFNNWDMFSIPMYKVEDGWETKINLPEGKYYYKFIVDGYWTNDPRTPESELAKDGKGHGGLTILYVE